MDCDTFSILPKDGNAINVSGYRVEYKGESSDFSGLFQVGQLDIYASYITERCLSHILKGQNSAHILVDGSLEQFSSLCKEVIATSLEESTSCKVSGFIVKDDSFCLLSGSSQPLQFIGGWGTTPFKRNLVEDVKSVEIFEKKVLRKIFENIPASFDALCLSIGFEIIPSSGSNITKLFPEMSVLMTSSDDMFISKMISDIAMNSNKMTERVISTSMAANTIGFYLDGNFYCSATFNCKTLLHLRGQLSIARNMRQIKTFPIVNDAYSKWLIARVSFQVKDKDAIDASVVKSMKNDLQSMAKDNVRLMTENENLHKQIDDLGVEMNNLLGSKKLLSDEVRQKLTNEQDIYNKFAEMTIEKVKIQDNSETKKYELMNKIFSLENDLLNAQISAEEWKAKFNDLESEMSQLQTLKDDLQAEYISMKTNHHDVVSRQGDLQKKCEQLSLELVQLHMEYDECRARGIKSPSLNSSSPLPEIKRHVSFEGPKTVEEFKIALYEQKQAAKSEQQKLVQEVASLKDELSELTKLKVKNSQQKELLQHSLKLQGVNETHKQKISALEDNLYKEVRSKEDAINQHSRLQANYNAISLLNSKLESENLSLRQKVQFAIEEYRARLDKYIKDTESYLKKKNSIALQTQMTEMVNEFKKSYVKREAELLEEVNSSKSDLLDTLEKYHKMEHSHNEISNSKLIQSELARLRKENTAHKDALKSGKIVPIEKMEELMGSEQEKFHLTIETLKSRASVAESQLARFMQHLKK